MRILLVFGTVALVLCLASLVSAQGQVTGGQKTDPKKDKSGKAIAATKKTDTKKTPGTNKGTSSSKGTSSNKEGLSTLKAKSGLKEPPPKPPQQKYFSKQLKTSADSGKLKLDPAQKGALDKLLGGQQPLTPDDRQQLSGLLFKGSQAGLTSDDEAALSYLLTDEMTRSQSSDPPPPSAAAKSTIMSIRVHNKTTEPIKLFVQIVAREPGQPLPAKDTVLETLKYDLQAGKSYDLLDKGKGKEKIMASTIRIWAISPSQQWVNNRDQDLALTSDTGSKVFAVTFSPPTPATAPDSGKLSNTPQKR